ncbi:MAG: hypothetical protein U0359_25390 [Byssovorax sp.]
MHDKQNIIANAIDATIDNHRELIALDPSTFPHAADESRTTETETIFVPEIDAASTSLEHLSELLRAYDRNYASPTNLQNEDKIVPPLRSIGNLGIPTTISAHEPSINESERAVDAAIKVICAQRLLSLSDWYNRALALNRFAQREIPVLQAPTRNAQAPFSWLVSAQRR